MIPTGNTVTLFIIFVNPSFNPFGFQERKQVETSHHLKMSCFYLFSSLFPNIVFRNSDGEQPVIFLKLLLK